MSKPYVTVERNNLIGEKHRMTKWCDNYPVAIDARHRVIKNEVGRRLKRCKRNYFKEKLISKTK